MPSLQDPGLTQGLFLAAARPFLSAVATWLGKPAWHHRRHGGRQVLRSLRGSELAVFRSRKVFAPLFPVQGGIGFGGLGASFPPPSLQLGDASPLCTIQGAPGPAGTPGSGAHGLRAQRAALLRPLPPIPLGKDSDAHVPAPAGPHLSPSAARNGADGGYPLWATSPVFPSSAPAAQG